MSNLRNVAKKVQGALPIVGLVSRLASPEGGFGELSYAEFSRSIYDKGAIRYRACQAQLEELYGKPANSRWLTLIMWMVKLGVGIVPSKDIISAARRLRITQDMEIEIDRFEQTKEAVLKKYQMMDRPEGKLKDKLAVAVDAMSTLVIGAKDGVPVPENTVPLFKGILQDVFPEADAAAIDAAIADRTQRALAYA